MGGNMKTTSRYSRAITLAIALSLAALPLVAVSCGQEPGGGGGADGALLAKSDVSRLSASAPQTDIEAAARSLQQFGTDMYGVLADQAGGANLVFSPTSIVTALAMTYAGAAGTTAEEMAATLHFTLVGDALHQAFNSLDVALESRSWQGKNADGGDEGVLVKTANSLWAQKDLVFEKIFLDTLAANYGAGVRLVDYKTAAEAARKAINEWVAGETNDKIPELISEGTLDSLTRLVLVNAVYLDATWANQFEPRATADGQFTTLAGQTVTTPMMNQEASFPYATGNGWQAVELPYLHDELSMLVIVSDDGRFAEVESSLATGLIDDTVAGLSQGTKVALTMPKFEFRTQAGLNDILKALGMTSAFDPLTADFSGMTAQEKLYISDVIHEAYIAVDEEGTEAAAATAVIMASADTATIRLVELTIDRPFIFAVRDRETGAILFLGRVTDPTT